MTRWTANDLAEYVERAGGRRVDMPVKVDVSRPPFGVPFTPTLIIELSGDPKGKGRPRFSRKSGVAYTPAPTRNYEAALRLAGQAAMLNAAPVEGPLKIVVDAFFGVPRSWSARKRDSALSGLLRPTGRPDADNLLKVIDSFNGVVWRDDSQIVLAIVSKRYCTRPRLRIEVEKLMGEAD